ncbi:MAG TPA: chorismate mutase [Candidatus Monoglobus merdigallinarum]|uniref:Bifunctional chorismate mutase/prephenate dehydratase n=1 Tax=Candidatus Monoglobus merdigallinarum TaxID=2838698 RepID=A0A9D1PT23_9FIRM|nr:chorismate mutase [Candidatus Monoglobus merdigallinarum]
MNSEKNKLDELRQGIDKLDKQILELFLKRMEFSSEVAEYKRKTGMPVLDSKREKQVLENKMGLVSGEAQKYEVYQLFTAIMSISRDRQTRRLSSGRGKKIEDILKPREHIKNPSIVFYGAYGSYSEQAAVKYFGSNAERFCRQSFEDVFLALEAEEADYAVLPIENSNTGTIVDVMDLLGRYNYFIVGEVDIPIVHCLMGVKGAAVSDIKRVFSHEQGIIQSREFLKTLGDVECHEYYSTSRSARKVAEDKDKTQAAIAGRQNAELYGLEILAEGINNSEKNTTRFIVVSKEAEISGECDKISAAFTLPHESGELYRILACFAYGSLNLLKLESRPLYDKNFEYIFYVDYTGNLLDENVRRITNNVIEGTGDFKLLGNYRLIK